MARPIPDILLFGQEGWDAEANNNWDLTFKSPIPVKEFLTVASLPAAGSFDNCVALVIEPGFKRRWFVSNGTIWIEMTPQEPRKLSTGVGAEAANKIRFTLQLQDEEANSLAEQRHIRVWMSDTDKGPAQNTGMVGNMVQVAAAVKVFNHAQEFAEFLTKADGEILIDVEVSDARTKFMVIDTGFGIFSQTATWT